MKFNQQGKTLEKIRKYDTIHLIVITSHHQEQTVESENIYSSPQSDVTSNHDELVDVKAFTTQGRLGRIHYLLYSMGYTMLGYLILGVVTAFTISALGEQTATMVLGLLALVTMLPLFIFSIIWTVRRCHDFNTTGWLALLLIVPLAPLIFWFIPGTKGTNRFGNKPKTGPWWGLLLLIVPVLILAAIAIPAYQDYVKRAQEMQMNGYNLQISAPLSNIKTMS